jgi:hypothetical protein
MKLWKANPRFAFTRALSILALGTGRPAHQLALESQAKKSPFVDSFQTTLLDHSAAIAKVGKAT